MSLEIEQVENGYIVRINPGRSLKPTMPQTFVCQSFAELVKLLSHTLDYRDDRPSTPDPHIPAQTTFATGGGLGEALMRRQQDGVIGSTEAEMAAEQAKGIGI